jgi:hypothetical protein
MIDPHRETEESLQAFPAAMVSKRQRPEQREGKCHNLPSLFQKHLIGYTKKN